MQTVVDVLFAVEFGEDFEASCTCLVPCPDL